MSNFEDDVYCLMSIKKMKQNKIITFLLGFVLLFCLSNNCDAQETVSIKGIIEDSLSKKPIPYVNIIHKASSTGVSANEEGVFELLIPSPDADSVSFSAIGYHTLIIAVLDLQNSTGLVKLSPVAYSFPEVVINGSLTPLGIVKKAIAEIPNNYGDQPFRITGYYREYTQEEERYGRYVEALVSVYDKGSKKAVPEKFKITALKKSDGHIDVFPEVKRENHLDDLFSRNPIKYKGLFNKNELEKTTFKIDSLTYIDNEEYYVISFTLSEKTGVLLINSKDYSILELKINSDFFIRMPDDSHQHFLNYSYTIRYRKYQNRLFVSYISYSDSSDALEAKDLTAKHNTNFFAEFMASQVDPAGQPIDPKEEMNKNRDLFIQYDSFNTTLLTNSNILVPTEAQKAIEKQTGLSK